MSRTVPRLVIDARPRGPSGLLAGERVHGRSVIEHLVELAESVGDGDRPIAIHARQDEHDRLTSLLRARPSSRYRLALGPPPEDAAILRADRVYDASRLRKAIRRGLDIESAVQWRIDTPHTLVDIESQSRRRRENQPLGRFWAARPAEALARRLVPTHVRPNHLTVSAGAAMLAGAGLIAFGGNAWTGRLLPSAAIALALVLDTADGNLARLQGTACRFGRWLDANLDELGDMALHAAIAWSAYARSGLAGWLVVGMAYGMAKFLFMFGSMSDADVHSSVALTGVADRPGPIRRLAHFAGHADLRLHLWIALAALGRLEIELATYACYFLARALGGAWRKAGRHAA